MLVTSFFVSSVEPVERSPLATNGKSPLVIVVSESKVQLSNEHLGLVHDELFSSAGRLQGVPRYHVLHCRCNNTYFRESSS